MKYAYFTRKEESDVVFMAGESCILNGIETVEITKERYDAYIEARQNRKSITIGGNGSLIIEN